MNNQYITRTTRISIMPKGEPTFSETCTHISIDDEAAGEFVKITQQSGHVKSEYQVTIINAEEWPAIKAGIEMMLNEIKQNEQHG